MIDLNDVLLAMSNIPVDDPIAEIWGRGLQGGYKIIEYTGSLPITINANGDALIDYRIYGVDGGVGERTESGEPAGYKLPMTVYKQEFMVTGDMLDQSNWVLSPPAGYTSCFMYFDISDLISKEECVAKIYENFSAMYTPEKLVVALTDDAYALVDAEYRILNNYGTILNREFDFSSWDKIYLCIGYGDGFLSEARKQSKIDELFENWKILIAPTSQTRESPVYIGENQLTENEYVSFSDQKIYKYTENLCPPQDSGAWNAGYITTTGDASVPTSAKEIYSYYIAVSGDQTYNFKNFSSFPSGDGGSWYAVGIYDANKNFVSRPSSPQHGVNNNLKIHLPSNAAYVRLTFRTYGTNDNQLSFTLGNIPPTQFIPYITLTDPPVPLPEITTIKGETVIDYDGIPKPSQMYVKYKSKG